MLDTTCPVMVPSCHPAINWRFWQQTFGITILSPFGKLVGRWVFLFSLAIWRTLHGRTFILKSSRVPVFTRIVLSLTLFVVPGCEYLSARGLSGSSQISGTVGLEGRQFLGRLAICPGTQTQWPPVTYTWLGKPPSNLQWHPGTFIFQGW